MKHLGLKLPDYLLPPFLNALASNAPDTPKYIILFSGLELIIQCPLLQPTNFQ